MGKFFGTDGVRGIANEFLSPELVLKIGKALACHIINKKSNKPTILIGRDTRVSGDMIEGALSAALTSMGCDVLLAGIIPTPAIAYLARTMDVDCGVVISASHNPVIDNGIKFFDFDGLKFSQAEENQIEKYVEMGIPSEFIPPVDSEIGRVMILPDASQRYQFYVQSLAENSLEGLRIALDCANGSTCSTAPAIFSYLKASVTIINGHPDGININRECGSTHPELLQNLVKAGNFDIGLAFDGDGDRLIAVDETGELIDGDEMMNIFAGFYHQQGKLRGNQIVATVMSNIGLEVALKQKGLMLLRSQVGDRNVMELMEEKGANIGGEQSGHIIFLDDNTTGDGIITGLKLVSILKATGKKASELKARMEKFPQVLINVQLKNKEKIMENPDFLSYLEEKQGKKDDKFRILVRASGTEPLIRVMVEGPDLGFINKLADEITEKVKKLDQSLSMIGSRA
ncbi:MAG: phosphoglucosamine mutase [Vulcanimicrobiota bacterium]